MSLFLGLGSNQGDRKLNCENAIRLLSEKLAPKKIRVSPVYETKALLPVGAPDEWNKPFLNGVVELEGIDEATDPKEILKITQAVEKEIGRIDSAHWSPRMIDIDLLLLDDVDLKSMELTLPHSEIKKRAFVLDPLKDLCPQKILPGEAHSLLSLAREHSEHAPVWMGILNITPDSFSDGKGERQSDFFIQKAQKMLDQNIGIIDLGAESTRPYATSVSHDEEWARLHPVLGFLKNQTHRKFIKPKISIDTRNFQTAVQAMEYGIDCLNDVSGLADERFIELLQGTDLEYVLMHSLSVPADPKKNISNTEEMMDELALWFEKKINQLVRAGVKPEKIILDPGIGFGKTAWQSQVILQKCERFFDFNLRVLVGHSRKSFLSSLSQVKAPERDLESIGVSLALIKKGVDILRVHDPENHSRAFQGWSHVWRK